jgi:hypothetical protein
MSDKMSIDKKDPSKENSEDESPVSTPENEAGPSNPSENQPAKRKGGRKPIYATSEERTQRNRQAQAAFRERRTEYIKQLEETIRVHEGNLTSLQTAHRSAADECLMLRYKNSLLERILLEKGSHHIWYPQLSQHQLNQHRYRCSSRASSQDRQPKSGSHTHGAEYGSTSPYSAYHVQQASPFTKVRLQYCTQARSRDKFFATAASRDSSSSVPKD